MITKSLLIRADYALDRWLGNSDSTQTIASAIVCMALLALQPQPSPTDVHHAIQIAVQTSVCAMHLLVSAPAVCSTKQALCVLIAIICSKLATVNKKSFFIETDHKLRFQSTTIYFKASPILWTLSIAAGGVVQPRSKKSMFALRMNYIGSC